MDNAHQEGSEKEDNKIPTTTQQTNIIPNLNSPLPLVTLSLIEDQDDHSTQILQPPVNTHSSEASDSSSQAHQARLGDFSPSSGSASGDVSMIPKDQNPASFPFLQSHTNMGSDSDPSIYSLIDSETCSKKLSSSDSEEHQFLLHPLNPNLPVHVLLDQEDTLSHSSDSSDLLDTDSEDEDVISIPLRGRTISYVRSALCDQPCCQHRNVVRGNGKCKTIDAYSMDFKLKVLEWAYTKTIHSAGHHFNLERCVVRNWMMNEEKIVMLASSKGRRKWAQYDQRQKKHKESANKLSRTKPLDARILKAIGGLRVSGNRS